MEQLESILHKKNEFGHVVTPKQVEIWRILHKDCRIEETETQYVAYSEVA